MLAEVIKPSSYTHKGNPGNLKYPQTNQGSAGFLGQNSLQNFLYVLYYSMNIFALDESPAVSAQYMADQHINKMLLESIQLLSNALHEIGLAGPYKLTHRNHPCSVWARSSWSNWLWLYEHAWKLCAERHVRWVNPPATKCQMTLLSFKTSELRNHLPKVGLTPFAQAMPEECKRKSAIDAYRVYYRQHKSILCNKPAKWTGRPTPIFMLPEARVRLLS